MQSGIPSNLGDRDNYEHLCLDTVATPFRASMKGGLLMDPRDDPNPATAIDVAGTEPDMEAGRPVKPGRHASARGLAGA